MIKQHGSEPATIHYPIVPSDNILNPIPRMMFVLTSGNLVMADSNGTAVTYSVTAGTTLLFRPTKVLSDTTASLVAWL